LAVDATVTFNVIRVVRPRLSTVNLDDVELPIYARGREATCCEGEVGSDGDSIGLAVG